MTYDATGLATVLIEAWPLLAWNIDPANLIAPVPITIGNPIKTPPNTGAIVSPSWVYCIDQYAVYVADTWRGTLDEFFTWLVTNNGATRKASALLTFPELVNVWNLWVRENPNLVYGPVQRSEG
jgi:hypothetical protein